MKKTKLKMITKEQYKEAKRIILIYESQNPIKSTELKMSARLRNVLDNCRIYDLNDLRLHTEDEVSSFRGMGKTTLEELKKVIKKANIKFKKLK